MAFPPVRHRPNPTLIESDYEMFSYDGRTSFFNQGEAGRFSCDSRLPMKKLERSINHSIHIPSIHSDLKQRSMDEAIVLFDDNNVGYEVGGNAGESSPENIWITQLDSLHHSNGVNRRVLELPPRSSTGSSINGLQISRKLELQRDQWNHNNEPARLSNYHSPTSFSRGEVAIERTSSTSSSWSSLDISFNDEYGDFIETEQRFLSINRDFAESLTLEMVRREEYPDLRLHPQTYMDYANFALASKFQTEEHTRIVMAQEHNFGTNSTSHLSKHVSDVHTRLLRMFNTTKSAYSVVFTTSFRTAYRLVANAYPFRKGSPLLVCQDNHACVRQLINAAVNLGAQPILARLAENDLCMTESNLKPLLKRRFFHPSGSLFVYPAQSNITGIRHSLDWILRAQKSNWQVLLDVSSFLPTGLLDLSQYQPDFVVGSFENMVGYPSSMGYLLVKRSSFCVSVNRFPEADSTITLTSKAPAWRGEDHYIVCEDESPPLLLFASINFGLQHLQTLGLELVNRRVRALAHWIVHNLKSLRHEDEFWHLVNVYSPFTEENRGSIISFNVLESSGEHIKPTVVKKLAAKYRITLGVATCINPGVANLLGPSNERKRNLRVFSERYSSEFSCVQVSLGPISNFEDAYRLVQFLLQFRDPGFVPTQLARLKEKPPSEQTAVRCQTT